MLVCFTFHDLIYPGLAAGDIEVSVVSETLLAHWYATAAGPGGVAYLVVCRETVDHRSPVRIGNHRQVVRFVIQPLAAQGVVAPVMRILCREVTGLLLRQHSCRGGTLAETEPGFTLPGYFLVAQVMLHSQRGMAGYLPLCEFSRHPKCEILSDA